MEENSGHSAVPPFASSADKSRILDVKPLRSLRPIFPPSHQAAPFVCASPTGPFPAGYTSFYPVYVSPPPSEPELPQAQEVRPPAHAAASPMPIRSFRTPGSSDGPPPSVGK